MLLADGIMLLLETLTGLPTQLNSLHKAAARLERKVNMDNEEHNNSKS